jgi:hypothetical protein
MAIVKNPALHLGFLKGEVSSEAGSKLVSTIGVSIDRPLISS